MARGETTKVKEQSAVDPAALGALIPTDGEDDSPGLATLGDEAPPLQRYEPTPPPVSQGQVQKARRVAAQTVAPAPAAPVSPRREIAKMVPSSHRVFVYRKRTDGVDSGKTSYLNDYSAQDLSGSGTIENFIKKYVVPEYGYGDFVLYYHDGTSNKEPQPLGSVKIDPPISFQQQQQHKAEGGMSEVFRDFLQYQKDREARDAQAAKSKTITEEMMETMMADMIKKQMGGGDEKGGGMNAMLMMMMMDRMKPAPAPSVDPAMQRFMERMADRLDAMEQEMKMSQAMLPPPSPIHEGPSHIEVILETMRENSRMMIEALKSQQVNRDPIKDLADMATLLVPQKSESLTIRDLFEIMPKLQTTFQPKEQTSPFKETVENFRLFKLMQREFSDDRPQAAQQEQQDNFWAFARDMLRSDVGRGIAAQIMKQAASQDVATQGEQRARQQQQHAREVARRRAEEASRQRQIAEARARQAADLAAAEAAKAAAAAKVASQAEPKVEPKAAIPESSSAVPVSEVIPTEQPTLVEVPAAAAPPPPEPAPPPPEPPPPSQMEEASSEEEENEEEGGDIQVPEAFLAKNAQEINDAKDDATRIEAVIGGLQALAVSQDFYGVIAKMFGLTKQNRKKEALAHLYEILEFFSDNDVLRKDIPKLVCDDFSRHWKIIRQQMKFEDTPEIEPDQVSAE